MIEIILKRTLRIMHILMSLCAMVSPGHISVYTEEEKLRSALSSLRKCYLKDWYHKHAN
jgi:hypothetical protein